MYFKPQHSKPQHSTSQQSKARLAKRHALTALLLLVLLGPLHAAFAQTPVSWWRGDGNALDAVGGNNGTLNGGVTYGPGAVNQGFVFDGSNGVVNIPDSPSLAISGSLRITVNIYVNQLPSYLGQIFFRGDNRSGLDPYGLVLESNGNLDFHLSDANGNNADILAPVPLHQWLSIDVSLDNTTGQMLMIINHQVVARMTTSIRPFRDLDPTQNPGLAIGNTQDPGSYDEPFNGTIDELKVYNTVSFTHVLWNNSDGKAMLWSVAPDGTQTQNTFGPYTDGSPNTPWSAKALATGPDGLSHILWTNPDGKVILWTVDDAGNFTYAAYGPYTDGSPSTPWSATALSVGADNIVHILWTNPDHRVILWNVDSAFNFTNAVFGPYDDGAPNTFWSATAIATGPDNVTRLVWNNPDGRVILWNVNNAFQFTYHVYGPYNDGAPNTPWSASAVSVGPDNVTHLLWTNPDTRVILWNLDSAFNFTLAAFGPYTDGSASTPWGATALATGPDGLSHLLWTNPDSRVILWGVDSAFNFTYSLYGPYTDGAAQNVWSATAISAGP